MTFPSCPALLHHLHFFFLSTFPSVFSWPVIQQTGCAYSCGVMSFSHLFLSIHLSTLYFFLWCRVRWGLWGGCERVGTDWKCVCVSEWNLTLRVGGGWWPLTLQRYVCVVALAPRCLSPGLNLMLNRTSTVFHCGAFPHASLSMYDSLSNQREGDASVSDLIEPSCPRSAFQMLPPLKKQN